MSEEPDLIQEGIRQAIRRDAIKDWRGFLRTLEVSAILTPILLALILWRVW